LPAVSLGVPALSSRSAFSESRSARSKSVACASACCRISDAARETSAGSGPGFPGLRRGRPKMRPSSRPRAPEKERDPETPKGGKLPSLMSHIINRRALPVVILLSILLGGCSGVFGESPSEQADAAIVRANEAISEHNRLFDEARGTYADVKTEIESGGDPSEQADRITEARDTMEQARERLQEARSSLGEVSGLDVDPTVKRYASLLSDAMDAQISAEDKEIQFYAILEEDPALENNRQEVLDLLTEVGDDYERAEEAYAEAREVADSNPDLIEATNES
jgi:hypothetical protein